MKEVVKKILRVIVSPVTII